MNIVICEPSPQQAQMMHQAVANAFAEYARELLVFCFSGSREMAEYLSVAPDPPDLILLSLSLKDMTYQPYCKLLRESYPKAWLVLTGPVPEDVEGLFRLGARYFLYEPIREGSLGRFAAFASQSMQDKSETYLELKEKREWTRIALSKILYVSSDRRKISVMQPNGVQSEAYKKLDEVQEELDDRFVRCHQSFLVNMDYITGITSDSFRLLGDIYIPISQKRYWASKKQYVSYMKQKG